MVTPFTGDLGSDVGGASESPVTSGVATAQVLDSLVIVHATGQVEDVHPEDSLIRFLRTRRSRPSAARCRRNARRSAADAQGRSETDAFDFAKILPLSSFLRLLQREQRRADRSHAPLSLMLFRVNANEKQRASPLEFFARCLHARKRETDYLGRLADDVFVVLLPETPADGLRRFDDRLRRTARALSYSSFSATYPEDRLEPLLEGYESPLPAPTSVERVPAETPVGATSGYALKRVIDVVGAVSLLLLAAPIMFVTALAILLTSPGPVIFRQRRLGKGGVPFVFYKFRSMRVDARDDIHRKYVEDLIKGRTAGDPAPAHDRLAYKMNGDPRITRVGRWIRKTSIDELPQLWNVLKGEMSLVGPRPPIPYEAENYQSWHLRRVLEVKPGITGLWQVEGRSRVSFDDMVRMDLQYAQNCSLWLDLRILARTMLVILRCDGAG